LQLTFVEIKRRRKKMKKLASLTIVLLFSLSAVFADEPVRYTNETLVRLSYINGNVLIQRATELEYEEGLVNMPVTVGDRMVTIDGRAEIHMGRGKFLRLDRFTKMDFINLPDPKNDLSRIQIWRGNIYLSLMSLKREKAIEIHTRDASFYVLEAGLYRIDVKEAETEIWVFRGLLEAVGETGSVLVRDAQRMEASFGHFLGRPAGFVAVATDSFDRWSEGRDLEVRKRLAQRYLPAELEDFEYELASYGQWNYVSPYGYVWIPGGVASDWRPYWHGRWVWYPICGWTWVSYEPWGWATFHYGRWHWSSRYGWYWIPTTVWGPGWVDWYSGYDYVGWAPVSYGGMPSVIIDNFHYPPVLTVIHKDQLRAKNISTVALSQNSVKNIGKLSLVGSKPNINQISSSKIRLKSKGNSPSVTTKGTNVPTPKVTKSGDPKKVRITSQGIKKKGVEEEKNSPKTTTETKPNKTSTTLGKITRIGSSNKSSATKTSKSTSSKSSVSKSSSSKSSSSKKSSPKSSVSKKIKPSSISKSSSKVKKSSPSKNSSKTRVSSKKVKKTK
jgi:hypothetical protein